MQIPPKALCYRQTLLFTRHTVALLLSVVASGCFLVNYEEKAAPRAARDAGPAMDAQVVSQDRDADTPPTDGAVGPVDAGMDGAVPACETVGCPCVQEGPSCSSSRRIVCEAGLIAEVTECALVVNQCKEGFCDAEMGCIERDRAVGSPCDDGKFCTLADSCNEGVCSSATENCLDSVCVDQHCDEQQGKCVVDTAFNDKPCGEGFACQMGVCTSTSNCSGICTPNCEGETADCNIACRDAQSCTVACEDRQSCNIDCESSDSCTASCNEILANCDVSCKDATACNTTCMAGDCDTRCELADQCSATCSGQFSLCPLDCDNSLDCALDCSMGAHCQTSCVGGGSCASTCSNKAQCQIDCRNSETCTPTCQSASNCDIDCRGADSCNVKCESLASCSVRCDHDDPDCDLECTGIKTKCRDGWACNSPCP